LGRIIGMETESPSPGSQPEFSRLMIRINGASKH
jgi:hypothetical protein